MNNLFRKFSHRTSRIAGSPWMFVGALVIIIGWAVAGPVFNFSNTWQLFINTGTTIFTFLMVILIQNTQNRDAQAIHLKLDEVIRSIDQARNDLIDIEDMNDEALAVFQKEFDAYHPDEVKPSKKDRVTASQGQQESV